MNTYYIAYLKATPVYAWNNMDTPSYHTSRNCKKKIKARDTQDAIDRLTRQLAKNRETILKVNRMWQQDGQDWLEIDRSNHETTA